MGRKNKKCVRKPPMPSPGIAPAPTNANWEDSTAAFQKEADGAVRISWDDCVAARLAERHPASPLALHILGHSRASLGRAGYAVPPLRRAKELAPRCPEIAATLASALLYARRPRLALAECARALAVNDPTDPALHAACRRDLASSPQARVAAARERILGVRADAVALAATGVSCATVPVLPLKPPCCCRHATTPGTMTSDEMEGLLTVSVADLEGYSGRSGSVHGLTGAVEFVKATNAWAYWLCPVCNMVFMDASSFISHVEGEYIPEIQTLEPLMPKRASLDFNELYFSSRWKLSEIGEEDKERRRDLDRIREAFSGLCAWKALPASLVSKVIKFARSRSKKPLPYCIPYCVTSLDQRELNRLRGVMDHLRGQLYNDWEFLTDLRNKEKNKGNHDIISLVQDGSILSLDAEKIASRNGDGSSKVDVLTSLLFSTSLYEDSVTSWFSLRQKCVHHGNEILTRIYEKTALLFDLSEFKSEFKSASKKMVHKGYFLTKEDSADVEMLLLCNEVDYLKKELAADQLNNNSPGKDTDDWDNKDASGNGCGSDAQLDENFFDDKIPGTDSYVQYEITGTEESENSLLSLSDSLNASTLETESASIDSGIGSIPSLASDEPYLFYVILRALWHLREFHDRFLAKPLVLPHVTVGVHCVTCLLHKIFNAWDNEKDHGANTFPSDVRTAFNDILNERNICRKAGTNIASEVISTIFDMLHDSRASSYSDFASLEYQGLSTSRILDFVCLPHNVFGLPIREQKKCNCLKESCEKKEYTTFFHSIDISAIRTIEVKSLGQLMRDGDTKFQYDAKTCQCENNIERSLRSAPPIFATVLCWPVDREVHINMSELLISIDTILRFDILYKVMHGKDYTLSTVVCCVEDEHFCFARQEEKWIIYGSNKVEFEDTWESLLHRYRHKSFRPQILFFERVTLQSA